MLYLFGNYYLDNSEGIDWDACGKIVEIYKNKTLERKFKNYQKKYAK